MLGFVPNRKLPLTNNLSLDAVEPMLTVSFVLSTNNVPSSTFNSVKVSPMFFQLVSYMSNVAFAESKYISPFDRSEEGLVPVDILLPLAFFPILNSDVVVPLKFPKIAIYFPG